jgi:hypothetical protein
MAAGGSLAEHQALAALVGGAGEGAVADQDGVQAGVEVGGLGLVGEIRQAGDDPYRFASNPEVRLHAPQPHERQDVL